NKEKEKEKDAPLTDAKLPDSSNTVDPSAQSIALPNFHSAALDSDTVESDIETVDSDVEPASNWKWRNSTTRLHSQSMHFSRAPFLSRRHSHSHIRVKSASQILYRPPLPRYNPPPIPLQTPLRNQDSDRDNSEYSESDHEAAEEVATAITATATATTTATAIATVTATTTTTSTTTTTRTSLSHFKNRLVKLLKPSNDNVSAEVPPPNPTSSLESENNPQVLPPPVSPTPQASTSQKQDNHVAYPFFYMHTNVPCLGRLETCASEILWIYGVFKYIALIFFRYCDDSVVHNVN
ncbi:hypothetical protein RFI_24014, partial [Reticulomyxa filosa]